MRERPWLGSLAALLTLLGLAAVLGVANPVRPPRISTDALGPEPGESGTQYQERAEVTLRGGGEEPRWALVSFDNASTTAAVADSVGRVRISQVLLSSSAAGAQSPLVTVSTGASADPAALLALAQSSGAAQLEADRAAAVAEEDRAVAVADLRAGCACVVGVLVRGTLVELRGIAERPGVQAVEALPADAVFGRFAVRALFPAQQP